MSGVDHRIFDSSQVASADVCPTSQASCQGPAGRGVAGSRGAPRTLQCPGKGPAGLSVFSGRGLPGPSSPLRRARAHAHGHTRTCPFTRTWRFEAGRLKESRICFDSSGCLSKRQKPQPSFVQIFAHKIPSPNLHILYIPT